MIESYFKEIDKKVSAAYALCEEARKKGFDPEDTIAIPLAKDMAERVEGLISVLQPQVKGSGISKRINELEEKFGKLSWKVALTIALETARERFCKFSSSLIAMETGIRVGLAYLTLGVVASPLEGFVELKLKKRLDNGKEYFCLMYSGPIRSAGGTAAAVSVLVADYVRTQMGFAEYDPTEKEVKRAKTELYDYHERVTNLQYLPSEAEIEFLVQNLPVQIDGDPSEKMEVSNYKDLPRIETNILRNGFCLVIGECLSQKSPKILKQLTDWGKDFSLERWDFLKDFVKLQKSKKAKETKSESKIQPDFTYIKDLVAGRPILGFPLRNGGFRLRYGRCRNSGYSSAAISPATTYILDRFIAIGTQLKMERPGKAASMSTCDSIEGPLVKLNDGSVLRISTVADAKQHTKDVAEIIYLGDILINYGDFFNRAHPLVPAGYCEEWWMHEIEKKGMDFGDRMDQLKKESTNTSITAQEALEYAKFAPLHPKFTYYWNTLNFDGIHDIFNWLAKGKQYPDKIVMPYEESPKRQLELLGVPHKAVGKEYVVIEEHSPVMSFYLERWQARQREPQGDILEYLSDLTGITHRDRAGTFIGARMGRPEKAKVRKLDGQPHCLFPVGEEGGKMRSFQTAMQRGYVKSDFPMYSCSCGNQTVFKICERCGSKTEKRFYNKLTGMVDAVQAGNASFRQQQIDIKEIFSQVVKNLKLDVYPDMIKGVRGTSNRNHVPEHLAKGILRAKFDIPVNKDGTTRYDMTQLAITHFKPSEIGTPVKKLKQLGYLKDIHGKGLEDEEQVIELFPQDVILPACPDSPEAGADEILYRVSLFIDELLEKLYHQEKLYALSSKEQIVGELAVALAPHTSAGIVCRIIGFSKTQGFYAHPMLHAATRRDCDGDEACVTLLGDALLNFSRQYLPSSRGATQDAPLVLTSKLLPAEVDDMVFDIDVAWTYPLQLYESALQYKMPWEVAIEQIGRRLNTPQQYEGMGFTHGTSSINTGVKCSSYKLLPTMEEKLKGQMALAQKIRAVDQSEVAKIVIEKHFIKDIRGNLRKFGQQQFRCVECNEKFRRPPLAGKCTKCGGKILFTVSEGSIVKYLEPALSLAEHYDLPAYLKQSLALTKQRVESLFGRDKEKQEGLGKWFG